ncbi:transcription modulator under heat shock [Escherichia phage REP3]|nr:transcription modulator under heat shock [Escherichia phage REP2]WCA46073.1 transcription modulator under heat shock [Escherichia phage REP3]
MEAILFEMFINSISTVFVKDVPITVAVMIDKRYDNSMYLVEDFISMPVPEDVEIKLKKIGIIETVQNSPFTSIQAFTKSNYIDAGEAFYNNKPLSFYSYDSVHDWKIDKGDKGNKFIIAEEIALSYFITSLWNKLTPNLLKIHKFDDAPTVVLGKTNESSEEDA